MTRKLAAHLERSELFEEWKYLNTDKEEQMMPE